MSKKTKSRQKTEWNNPRPKLLDEIFDKMFFPRLNSIIPIPIIVDIPAPPNGIKTEILLETTTSWDGAAYRAYPDGSPKRTVKRITLAPNYRLGDHEHTELVLGRVMTGIITVLNLETLDQKTFTAGDWIAETLSTNHCAFTGETTVILEVIFEGVA